MLLACWPYLAAQREIATGSPDGGIFPDSTFEVFAKVGDWRCYEDELLLLPPDEAGLWLTEIEEVQQALQGLGNLPPGKIEKLILEFYRDEPGSRLNLESRLDELAEKTLSSPVIQMKRNLRQLKRPDIESTLEKIIQALTDATDLCRASIKTGNSIRLLW